MRRLGILLVILFGSSFILFNLAAISGDPLEGLRTSSEPSAKQQIITLTRELHLNVPPPARYFIWLRGILGLFVGKIDFGNARNGQAVSGLVQHAIPVTIRLVTMATVVAIVEPEVGAPVEVTPPDPTWVRVRTYVEGVHTA